MKVTVTGASGFIGKELVSGLVAAGHTVHALSRTPLSRNDIQQTVSELGEITAASLARTDCFIHLAGLANTRTGFSLDMYRQSNTALTEYLAELCVQCKVKTFVFISTAKVHGDVSASPISANSSYNPQDYYSQSKVEAELALMELAGSMSVVTIRPPLVYGSSVKGNVEKIIHACRKRKPVPVPQIPNSRSFLYLENLCSAIFACMNNSVTGFEGYVLDDGVSLSTEEYFRQFAERVGSYPRFVYMPNSMLAGLDNLSKLLTGSKRLAPMYENFELDSDDFCKRFHWNQPYGTGSAIESMFS